MFRIATAALSRIRTRPMLLRVSRLKTGASQALAVLRTRRRLLLVLLLVAPTIAYVTAWLVLATTEAFFPRPLRLAKELLVVVAHPDDECAVLLRVTADGSAVLFAESSADVGE